MRAAVVGYGSIGARHARILGELGVQTMVVSARHVDYQETANSLSGALSDFDPQYVVISNATASHVLAVRELAALGFTGTVLVEKPLFAFAEQLPSLPFGHLAVAYNLRFHPLIRRLAEVLRDATVISTLCYVGQYLPTWRPGTDYRQSYSSHANRGGGVLRDLSHEIDYLMHLLGDWRTVSALGGHLSPLEGDSDDTFALTMALEKCPVVQLQMNYTDRIGHRMALFNTADATIAADLILGSLTVNDRTESFTVDRDFTYREMHRSLLSGATGDHCTLAQGMSSLRLIEAAEQAAAHGRWVQHA